MKSKERFEKLLKEIFVGVEVKGDSAIANLLKFKSKYFNDFIYDVTTKISKTKAPQEIYDKLYNFFSSYFNESGSLFFAQTPKWEKKFARLSNKDVELFYKTKDLYYIKTQKVYNPLTIKVKTFSFKFIIDELGDRKGNEKKEIEFLFVNFDREKKVLEFKVKYKQNEDYNELKKITGIDKPDKIRKHLFENLPKEIKYKKNYVFHNLNKLKVKNIDLLINTKDNNSLFEKIDVEFIIKDIEAIKKIADTNLKKELEDELKEAFKVYKKQSSIDYFIHKNAKEFLKEQFDLYMYEYFKDEIFDEDRLRVLKELRNIAYELIDKFAKFEEELKAIYLKPRIVFNSNYVITKDRLQEYDVLDKFLNHLGIDEQIEEWKELELVEEDFKLNNINDEKYKFLPFDTKYFKDIEIDLLERIDNLDEALDGRLIHSENFQALNTILPKYKNKIDLIYIDPPFNLGKNADFDYLVSYKDSIWATLLENRITLAKEFLSRKGSIFVRCDYNGNYIVRILLDEIFGKDNFKNEVILSKSAKLTEKIMKYHSAHDSLYFYTKSSDYFFQTQVKKRQTMEWREMHLPGERWSPIPDKYLKYFSSTNIKLKNGKSVTKARIILGKEVLPPKGRHWALSQETIFEYEKLGKIKEENNKFKIQEEPYQKLTDNWTDWVGYSSTWGFPTENHEKVLERVIQTASQKQNIVFDFFAGSSTTQAVAQKLDRKWLGIEIGEQFYNIELPRLKKVVFGIQSVISKDLKPKYRGSGFFKYISLEQYEDILKRAEYKLDLDHSPKLTFAIKINKQKAYINLNEIYKDKKIDIAETMSNLLGEKIKKINKNKIYLENRIIDLENFTFEEYPEVRKLIYWE